MRLYFGLLGQQRFESARRLSICKERMKPCRASVRAPRRGVRELRCATPGWGPGPRSRAARSAGARAGGCPEGVTGHPPLDPTSAARPTVSGVAAPSPAASTPEPVVEPCPRCAAAMEWRHGTFQCPRCRFKVGCCEGLTGDCRA